MRKDNFIIWMARDIQATWSQMVLIDATRWVGTVWMCAVVHDLATH